MNDISFRVREYLKSLGADLIGFASLVELPAEARWGFGYGISIAIAYKPETLIAIPRIPNDEYYAGYCRLNSELGKIALETEEYLKSKGYKAMAITNENRGLDEQTKTTILPHKTVATRAGLGDRKMCAAYHRRIWGRAKIHLRSYRRAFGNRKSNQ